MRTPNVLSKLVILLFAAVVANQLACSNASFEASNSDARQNAPQPDNVNSPFDHTDSGEAVRCDNVSAAFCDTSDDGLTSNLPPLHFTPPTCDVSNCGGCVCNTYKNTSRRNIDGVNVWLVVD